MDWDGLRGGALSFLEESVEMDLKENGRFYIIRVSRLESMIKPK